MFEYIGHTSVFSCMLTIYACGMVKIRFNVRMHSGYALVFVLVFVFIVCIIATMCVAVQPYPVMCYTKILHHSLLFNCFFFPAKLLAIFIIFVVHALLLSGRHISCGESVRDGESER